VDQQHWKAVDIQAFKITSGKEVPQLQGSLY